MSGSSTGTTPGASHRAGRSRSQAGTYSNHQSEEPILDTVYTCSTPDSMTSTQAPIVTTNDDYKCRYPGCNYEPKSKRNKCSHLKRHLLTHDDTQENRIQCPQPGCRSSFTAGRNDNLRQHLTHVHRLSKSEIRASPMVEVTPNGSLLGEPRQQDAMSVSDETEADWGTAISPGMPAFWQQQQTSPVFWDDMRMATQSFQMAEIPEIDPGWGFDNGMQLSGATGPSPSEYGSQSWSTEDWQRYNLDWPA